jgi:hypothetical protein
MVGRPPQRRQSQDAHPGFGIVDCCRFSDSPAAPQSDRHPTIAQQSPGNLIHLLFDNEIYEASGGTATASRNADAVIIARGTGYKHALWVNSIEEFRQQFQRAWERNELTLIAAKVDPGQPKDLPPLKLDEIENKYRFMRYLEATENKGILNPGFDSKLCIG